MTKAKHPSKTKKVYEVEKEFRDNDWFVFRRTSPHGLFHIIAMKDGEMKMIQVERWNKFKEKHFNNAMIKIMDFAEKSTAPTHTSYEMWVWLNNRGWMKYTIDEFGNYQLFETYGFQHFRMKKQRDYDINPELIDHILRNEG